jgi:uncharacterized protein (TIGR03435 family)
MSRRCSILGLVFAPAIFPQSAPQFDVASVKPCSPSSTGRGGMDLHCETVSTIIESAYTGYDSGRFDPSAPLIPIAGGPKWIDSETYRIDAKAEGVPESDLYTWALMMRSLLADRFQLKLHRETRQIPVYALTVARGGAKLLAHREGNCFAIGTAPRPAPGQPRPRICGQYDPTADGQGTDIFGITLFDLCRDFTNTKLDRPVIDRTAISGAFDFHFDDAVRDLFPGGKRGEDPLTPGAAIFTAIQKFGLRFERTTGPGDFLVIDRVERPSKN